MASGSKQACMWRKHLWGAVAALGVASCGGTEAALLEDSSNQSDNGLAAQCDLSGTWAVKIEVPVSWGRNVGVQGGSGKVVQYGRSVRKIDGTHITDTFQICGIDIPDYRSQIMFGNELYGIRFPNELFDGDTLPKTTIRTNISAMTLGSTWQSEPAAIQMGVDMNDPVNAPWPRRFTDLQSMVVDADGDGHPGLTLVADTTSGYSFPPTGMTRSATKRAKRFYAAVRNVATLSGTVEQCDAMKGRAEVKDINGRASLNSHVLGCGKIDGSECASSEIDLLDGLQPVYTAKPGTVSMRRLADDATCADVRNTDF